MNMDVFDNCRICLSEINHEPIKMTRLILQLLENNLLLPNVAKPCPVEGAKQNLCAPCFNRISEFQDFFEQCKESEEFWKEQFDDLKKTLGEEVTFEGTLLIPFEEARSLEADTTVSTTQVKILNHSQSKEKTGENAFESQVVVYEHNLRFEEKTSEDENETRIVNLANIDLASWQDGANDDNCETQTNLSECDESSRNAEDEIIEYEYKFVENEHVEIEPFDEVESPDREDADYDFERIERKKSTERTNETNDEATEETDETTQTTFFLNTSLDDNGKVKMTYKCPKCDKSFNRIYDIESHYNIHSGIKPFKCDVCGKSFRQKNILTTHQTLHFGKKVECAECGKKFARRSQLILHYRMHRDEKPFVCNIDGCQAAFRQRKQLNDHAFIHTGEKNFECATCSKLFHTRKRLQDHIYKVHSQHRYCCELCQKGFLKPHMLKHHMITVHNIEIDDVSHLKTFVDVIKPPKPLRK